MQVALLNELVSGVDALYMSGRASLPFDLLERLEHSHKRATDGGFGPPFQFGDVEMTMEAHGWGKYRYCLTHHYGQLGVTLSSRLPTFRIQPYAEFLHGAGPQGVVDWFRDLIESECGFVLLTVTRLDLFADFQGWPLSVDARREFLCKATARHSYEDNDEFNGLNFGKRATGSVTARLYGKTVDSALKGTGYWKMIWGDAYVASQPVLRIEFELGRDYLRLYGLSSPEETLAAVGSLWLNVTHEWLTHHVATGDQTKARWPISPQWECVQRASIAEGAQGINRMFLGRRRGSIENLMPGLTGYLSSFAAYSNNDSFYEMLPQLSDFLERYEKSSGVLLRDRIGEKRKKFGLP